MSDINIEVESGTSKRLLTAGKVCEDNIVVTAIGGSGGDSTNYISLINGTMTDFVAPEIDSIKEYLFYKDSTIQRVDFSKVVSYIGSESFRECTALTQVINPEQFSSISTSPFRARAFAYCTALETFEYLGRGSMGSATPGIFTNCSNLKRLNLPQMTMSGALQLLNNCTNIEEIYVGRITSNFQVGSGTTYGHLLKVECLVGLIQNLVVTTTTKTLTIGTANVQKLEGLYCRITDDTTDTLTMELCADTDEGAMPLEEYWTMKGWSVI